MACHDVCLDNKAPAGIEHLLGLGAKYCVKQTKLPANTIDNMMKRMRRNIRWKYIFRTHPEDDNYIPGLHINSEREPGLASSAIEKRMDEFEKAMRRERAKYSRRHICPNLTGMQAGLIKRLEKNEIYKVISADKNCGLAIIETEHLTERVVIDHLGDVTTYNILSKKEAFVQLSGVARLIEPFISKWKAALSTIDYTYLERALK